MRAPTASRFAPRTRRSKRRRTALTRTVTSSIDGQNSSSSDSVPESDSDFDPETVPTLANSDDEFVAQLPSSRSRRGLREPGKRPRGPRKRPSVNSAIPPSNGDFQLSSVSEQASEFSEAQLLTLRSSILDWYVDSCRSFPWRAAPRYRKNGLPPFPLSQPASQTAPGAPYAIWISEVMSQQTRIQVVVEYFNRWIEEFPTVQRLARAPLERVNEIWAGLGYYRRARFLHEGAKQVVNEHNGELPAKAASLRKLKGIGKYTAGAISSIAFGENEAAVDGNVERVLSRLLPALSAGENTSSRFSDACWSVANRCVEDIECAGDFNQAMMELGATICKPRAVQCDSCPLQAICGAYSEAKAMGVEPSEYVVRYPLKSSKKAVKVRDEAVAVLVTCVKRNGENWFLLFQRPPDGLLAGLWEFPSKILETQDPEDCTEALDMLLKSSRKCMDRAVLKSEEAFSSERCVDCGMVTHIFSHIRQSLYIKVLQIGSEAEPDANSLNRPGMLNASTRWIREKELSKCAISTQMKKVYKKAASWL